ncbi:MAG: hypothetical protein RLO81_18680 [Fulvivirga sp.]|uniref:hypothetical protein n=1 Tax=Fulvivirga sp. TaxID=1931237 RepID=UPI0032EAD628
MLILFSFFSCEESCDSVKCRDDIPAATFTFRLLDTATGKNLYFGLNPINHPDSVTITERDVQLFKANYYDSTLSYFFARDTVYFYPGYKKEIKDTLAFEFKSLGKQECCVEYIIIKTNYNGVDYFPMEDNSFTLYK